MASARALVALAVSVLALGLVPGAFAGQQSFTVPGTYEFTVPAGVTSLDVVAVGASGGNGRIIFTTSGQGSPGGLGARVEGTLTVIPGQRLQITVGGRGTNAHEVQSGLGGGGGGASDVRLGAFELADRVLVAGGGGGAGGTADTVGGIGGNGGGGAGSSHCLRAPAASPSPWAAVVAPRMRAAVVAPPTHSAGPAG